MSSHHDSGHRRLEHSDFDPSTQIRVLEVDSGQRGSPILAHFQICNIQEPRSVEWEAISYAWDGQTPTHEIQIDGEIVRVTRNVFEILQDLRLWQGRRYLWIDALCISQHDPDEKSKQVALMRSIYQEAVSVTIWLDFEDKETAAPAVVSAFYWMDALSSSASNQSSKPLMSQFVSENPHVTWQAPFHKMMTARWLRRAWVVQEALLAKTLFVNLGQDVLLWDDFASTVIKFMSLLPVRQAEDSSLEDCYRVCQTKSHLVQTVNGLSMINLVVNLRNWLNTFDTPLNPSELVYLCSNLEASLPADNIYAFAGLFGIHTDSASRSGFPIDYRLSGDEIYKAFTFWCIQQENNLDILAQQWHQPDRRSITGWVTDWSQQPSGNLAPTSALMERLRHNIPINSEIAPMCRRVDSDILIARGFIVDEIQGISANENLAHCAFGSELDLDFLRQWQRMIPSDEQANPLIFGQLYPTDHELERLYVKSWEKYPSFSHLWRDGVTHGLAVREQYQQGRWAYVTKRGCLALTVGYLDGNASIRIAYLNGGRGLFVLRPNTPATPVSPSWKPSYTVVSGDCFIDGFEDGKGYEMARRLGLGEEDICLV